MSDVQSIAIYEPEEKKQLVKVSKPSTISKMLLKEDLVEMSIFGGEIATVVNTAKLFADLSVLFPRMSGEAISIIQREVVLDNWTIKRVEYAMSEIKKYRYNIFAPGEFLNQDKKITFGRSELALRRKLKFSITQNDIVVVKVNRTYTDSDGIEQRDWMRAYAYKEEAEDMIPERIIGRWNDKECTWDFSETFFDHTTLLRQKQFKTELFKYCDMPPHFNGPYPIEFVKRYYEIWSQILPPGDMLRFENRPKFNVESDLECSYKKYQLSKTNN